MKAVMTFGRFQPPTIAHEAIFSQVINKAISEHAVPFIFTSTSKDAKTNPLDADTKVQILKWMCPFHKVVSIKGPVAALQWLSTQGYRDVILYAGEDRLYKFRDFLRYINPSIPDEKRINLDSLVLVSTGARDAESDTMEGISASKARHLATLGDYDTFKTMVPTVFGEENAKQIYMDVRKGLCLT